LQTGYLYFGLQKTNDGWYLREWAPNATEIFLIGSFNNWQREESYRLKRLEHGIWEIKVRFGSVFTISITINCLFAGMADAANAFRHGGKWVVRRQKIPISFVRG